MSYFKQPRKHYEAKMPSVPSTTKQERVPSVASTRTSIEEYYAINTSAGPTTPMNDVPFRLTDRVKEHMNLLETHLNQVELSPEITVEDVNDEALETLIQDYANVIEVMKCRLWGRRDAMLMLCVKYHALQRIYGATLLKQKSTLLCDHATQTDTPNQEKGTKTDEPDREVSETMNQDVDTETWIRRVRETALATTRDSIAREVPESIYLVGLVEKLGSWYRPKYAGDFALAKKYLAETIYFCTITHQWLSWEDADCDAWKNAMSNICRCEDPGCRAAAYLLAEKVIDLQRSTFGIQALKTQQGLDPDLPGGAEAVHATAFKLRTENVIRCLKADLETTRISAELRETERDRAQLERDQARRDRDKISEKLTNLMKRAEDALQQERRALARETAQAQSSKAETEAENQRLVKENKAMKSIKFENERLKKAVKGTEVEKLREELRHVNASLEAANKENQTLKEEAAATVAHVQQQQQQQQRGVEFDNDNDSDKQLTVSLHPHSESSSNSDQPDLSKFSNEATHLLQHLRGVLLKVSQRSTNVDNHTGIGWGAFETLEGLIRDTTDKMVPAITKVLDMNKAGQRSVVLDASGLMSYSGIERVSEKEKKEKWKKKMMK